MHIYSSTYQSAELNYPIIKKGSSTVLVHVIETYQYFSIISVLIQTVGNQPFTFPTPI